MTAYIAPEDVERYGDSRLGRWFGSLDAGNQQYQCALASELVDRVLRQHVLQSGNALDVVTSKEVVILPDNDGDSIVLPNRPVTTIESVTIYPLTGGEVDYDPSIFLLIGGYFLQIRGARGTQGPTFTGYTVPRPSPFLADDEVHVVYDCGMATIPASVKEACCYALAAHQFDLSTTGAAASEWTQHMNRLLSLYTVIRP